MALCNGTQFPAANAIHIVADAGAWDQFLVLYYETRTLQSGLQIILGLFQRIMGTNSVTIQPASRQPLAALSSKVHDCRRYDLVELVRVEEELRRAQQSENAALEKCLSDARKAMAELDALKKEKSDLQRQIQDQLEPGYQERENVIRQKKANAASIKQLRAEKEELVKELATLKASQPADADKRQELVEIQDQIKSSEDELRDLADKRRADQMELNALEEQLQANNARYDELTGLAHIWRKRAFSLA